MAVLSAEKYPLPSISDWATHEAEFSRLMEESRKATHENLTGAVINFQVADGYAYYVVVLDSLTTLVLQHVPFCDGYSVHPALIRGLEREDIIEILERDRRIQQLFRG